MPSTQQTRRLWSRRRLHALATQVAGGANDDRVASLQREWAEARERTASIERELAGLNAPFAPDNQEKGPPMAGITVLEVANWAATPAAGAILADLGAEVIKVEAIEGDSMRFALAQPKILNPQTQKDFRSGEIIDPEFNFANRGKKSICVNVGDPTGVAIVHRLAANCDIFLTNLLPGRLRQFSLTYDTIAQINPRAVYASMTPYGSSGPQSELTGFDFTAFYALGGVMGLMGDPNDKLMRAGNESYRTGMGDLPTALALTSAILSGLHVREKSGRGCQVETSLLRNAGFVIGCDLSVAMVDNQQPRP
jgi:crotonobetainyl-CoA:carnitine CoA-transferase CaiB-like acyl-CoA transferase